MKHTRKFAPAALLLILTALAPAQTQPAADSIDLIPGITLRPDGVIDIGDAFAEVNYYDIKWTIAQQHDRFEPAAPQTNAPTTDPGVHLITGVLTTAQGPANLTERVSVNDGAVNYSATLNSDKELATNELSVAFILPTKSFAGKQVLIDQQPLTLPEAPAAKGQAEFTNKDAAKEIELPTPNGTLLITGNFKVLVQDDREWGDPRYSMRLYFTPGSGQIKQSQIDLQLKWKAPAK